MSQKDQKDQPGAKKNKPVFVRGIKPSTKEWLERQKSDDHPTLPKVVRHIVEEEHRRQTGDKRKR